MDEFEIRVTKDSGFLLLVPSVVFDVERNALINPAHSDSTLIRLVGMEPIRWDDRLFPPR